MSTDSTTPMTAPTTASHRLVRTMASPIGELTLVATDDGVCAVLWPVEGEAQRTGVTLDDASDQQSSPRAAEIIDDAERQLAEYFAGERTDFDLPLDAVGTDFQQAAWAALREIEYGTTISYGEQAQRLGNPKASRAVGAANGKNPISIIVPCHRVVGSDGSLTGFAGGADAKRWLLDHEACVAGHRLV